jgi:hypothetical protein
MLDCRRCVAGLYQQNATSGISRNGACNADGMKHECPFIARWNARRAEDLDRVPDMF